MQTKALFFALGVFVSPLTLAAGVHNHTPHNSSPEGTCVDTSKQNAACQQTKEQSQDGIDHAAMGHGTTRSTTNTRLSVSDGSATTSIAMPYPDAMHMEDDPVLAKLRIDQLEVRSSQDGDTPWVVEGEAWLGTDRNKLVLDFDAEQVDNQVEEATIQLLYSRAIAPYWDFQIGVRHDAQPQQKNWGSLRLRGIAPYFVETKAGLFTDGSGNAQVRLGFEHEMMLGQRTALIPELGLDFSNTEDLEHNTGTGLTHARFRVRMRYEIMREIAPYLGAHFTQQYGKTATLARSAGEPTESSQFIAGVSFWF